MKKTKKFNFREAYERMSAIKARLSEMAEGLESDPKREAFTEAEQNEYKQLSRELDILEMKVRANTEVADYTAGSNTAEVNRMLREAIANNQRFEVRISRDDPSVEPVTTSDDPWTGPITTNNNFPSPITMGDIVEPLFNSLILSKIGSPLLTGLSGNYQWPVVEAFAASINGEGVALGDTNIPLTKLIARPERLGIAVPITREAINQTDDLLQTVCTKYMPVAIADLMNKIMFSTTKVTGATNLVGPFYGLTGTQKVSYATDVPAYADILALKGKVLKANIKPEGLCYVMTETTKALLEGTPKWSGAAEPIVDKDGRIAGVPVFTNSNVTEGDILFGAFKYAPQGIFGDMSLIVDPYTQARKNTIDFVINVDYAITVLRSAAFGMLYHSS